MAYLEIQGLGKRFGGTDILHDVDLALEQGQILSLIGPSGEGKTTLLRCLNFLETPDRGIIRLKGETLFDAAEMRLRRLKPSRRAFGLVFQAFHLFPQYTVLENVMLAPTLAKRGTRAELEQKAMDLIEKVGLKDKEFRTSAGLDLFATFLTVVKYLCHDVSRDHFRCTVQW